MKLYPLVGPSMWFPFQATEKHTLIVKRRHASNIQLKETRPEPMVQLAVTETMRVFPLLCCILLFLWNRQGYILAENQMPSPSQEKSKQAQHWILRKSVTRRLLCTVQFHTEAKDIMQIQHWHWNDNLHFTQFLNKHSGFGCSQTNAVIGITLLKRGS